MPTVQLALVPRPEPAPEPPPTYWEHRGPRDWRPVTVSVRCGPCSGDPGVRLPLVRTGRLGPRNVLIERGDGTADVVPVRNLRRANPWRPHDGPCAPV